MVRTSEQEKEALDDIRYRNEHLYCDKTDFDFLLNYIDKLQKENQELKEKIENEIKELEENEDFYREHDRMYEYEGKINLLKRLLAKFE